MPKLDHGAMLPLSKSPLMIIVGVSTGAAEVVEAASVVEVKAEVSVVETTTVEVDSAALDVAVSLSVMVMSVT